MSNAQTCRPWGELDWVLGLSEKRSWNFLGCLGTEERSVASLLQLSANDPLSSAHLLRIRDTSPTEPDEEETAIERNVEACAAAAVTFERHDLTLQGPLNLNSWPSGFDFSGKPDVCIDVSSLPKRFFFAAVKAALQTQAVKNLVVTYARPSGYPPTDISGNPDSWETMDNFGITDPDIESEVDSRLIVNAGFMVGGLIEHLENRRGGLSASILIPFPADLWSSVQRSWESARSIEESLQIMDERGAVNENPEYRRVGAHDTSTAFDILLDLTNRGATAAALAPLGPKPISLAFCLLASQTEKHPVYYAQPKAYAVNYSEGCEGTYGYWIKHDGENLYQV